HHAFSSGAGRTSDGNGSHSSTLKSPSYTKSVSWQHYPKVHPRLKTPYVSTLLVALISLVSGLWFYGDIDNLSRLVNFGALMGFLVLHVAVINHYLIRQKSRNLVMHLLFPVIGLCIIGFVIYEMDIEAKVLGLSWLAVGMVYYAIMRLVLKRSVELNLEG
ncbi:hypothetical protein MCU66_26940, partial [Klebsiella pneumoniae]|nr:hypothetical protein [Klebsiella pneumoniae]